MYEHRKIILADITPNTKKEVVILPSTDTGAGDVTIIEAPAYYSSDHNRNRKNNHEPPSLNNIFAHRSNHHWTLLDIGSNSGTTINEARYGRVPPKGFSSNIRLDSSFCSIPSGGFGRFLY
mmetsp:Transcript_19866/g.55373  ORF Transcript_19866/g.55373 Transcript_19866/m.55373 type:complete len:121 (-) Transcript_19866:985-1347(-)